MELRLYRLQQTHDSETGDTDSTYELNSKWDSEIRRDSINGLNKTEKLNYATAKP